MEEWGGNGTRVSGFLRELSTAHMAGLLVEKPCMGTATEVEPGNLDLQRLGKVPAKNRRGDGKPRLPTSPIESKDTENKLKAVKLQLRDLSLHRAVPQATF